MLKDIPSTSNIKNDSLIKEILNQKIEPSQLKLNCSSSSKNFLREGELSISKISDTSKDFQELNNEISKYVLQNVYDLDKEKLIDIVSNANSKSNSAIGIALNNDELWNNNNKNFENTESFEKRIEEMKKIYENQSKIGQKSRQIKMIKNVNKIINPLIEECIKNRNNKKENNNLENLEEPSEDFVSKENLNHLSAEKQNVPKFIISSSKEENNYNAPNVTTNINFNINNTINSNKYTPHNQWINYPARKLQFSSTTYSNLDLNESNSNNNSKGMIGNSSIENYYFTNKININKENMFNFNNNTLIKKEIDNEYQSSQESSDFLHHNHNTSHNHNTNIKKDIYKPNFNTFDNPSQSKTSNLMSNINLINYNENNQTINPFITVPQTLYNNFNININNQNFINNFNHFQINHFQKGKQKKKDEVIVFEIDINKVRLYIILYLLYLDTLINRHENYSYD